MGDVVVRLLKETKGVVIRETVGWQPIETAPKDGTQIDIWVEPDAGSIHGPSHYKAHRQANAFWCDRDPTDPFDKTGSEGWWCRLADKFAHEMSWKATHWMPLPEPPELNPDKGDTRKST